MQFAKRRKGRISALLLCLLALCGCGGPEKYTYDLYSAFDTRIRITGYAHSRAAFDTFAEAVHTRLDELHCLFDIYHTYDSLINLKSINDNAGIAPLPADPAIIELLLLYRNMGELTDNAVNPALGPILEIWHEYRERYAFSENGEIPPMGRLQEAYLLCDPDELIIDEAAGTVFLKKPGMSLDVGAAAKGFAIELTARELSGGTVKSFLIDAGGDVITRGTPPGRDHWNVGIQNPFPDSEGSLSSEPIRILSIPEGAAVTSGDYRRYYVADGLRLHHIIDPATLMPASRYRSVSVTGPDCAVAEILSTALFILPYEQGKAIADQMGYQAVWIFPDGELR